MSGSVILTEGKLSKLLKFYSIFQEEAIIPLPKPLGWEHFGPKISLVHLELCGLFSSKRNVAASVLDLNFIITST